MKKEEKNQKQIENHLCIFPSKTKTCLKKINRLMEKNKELERKEQKRIIKEKKR